MRKVCILYEDQRGPTRGFGLHELVKACARDALKDIPRRDVDAALEDCRPMKGTPKLLKACRQDIDLIASDGRGVIAVFDNDEIRGALNLSPKASDKQVHQRIREGGKHSDRLFVVLLKQNMESVIAAVRQCDGSVDPKLLDSALKKHMLDRDAILNGLAIELKRAVRDCIQDKMPSLRGLVELLCREISPRSKARGNPAPSGKRSRPKAR